jgi:hypothetical protein
MHRLVIGAALALASAASAAQARPFDAKLDKAAVTECFAAHMAVGEIASETLDLPESVWKAEDDKAGRRFKRLEPYFLKVMAGSESKAFYDAAVHISQGWEADLDRRLAAGAPREVLFKELVARSERCDLMVTDWGPLPGETR